MKFNAISIKKLPASRKGPQLYAVENIDDIPLTRRFISRFLNKSMGIRIEEIAFMYEDFRTNPNKKVAHFGVNGHFICSE